MNIVSNLINNISKVGEQGLGIITGANVNDTAFSNILDKEMQKNITNGVSNLMDSLGMPAGFAFEQINTEDLITNPIEKSESKLMNFAQKQAANIYNKYAGDIITSLDEFVSDALKLG